MGALVADSVPAAKGALCYCLDEFSIGKGARARVKALRAALAKLAPSYEGLTETFDTHLLAFKFSKAATRKAIVDHLNACWFDPKSPEAFFPGEDVSRIYAEGVIKALDLSLAGKSAAVPISSWWLLDAPHVRLISLANQKGRVTTGGSVTLLIETPRPASGTGEPSTSPAILGNTAQAHVTRAEGDAVRTSAVRRLK